MSPHSVILLSNHAHTVSPPITDSRSYVFVLSCLYICPFVSSCTLLCPCFKLAHAYVYRHPINDLLSVINAVPSAVIVNQIRIHVIHDH